jgi:hypothetical protein
MAEAHHPTSRTKSHLESLNMYPGDMTIVEPGLLKRYDDVPARLNLALANQ